ncbi:hypothetical protein [Vibrio mediterranei]|uniref:Uncharacterized protein n=1 Tax=Vibrio mediterranei TaxID=689 RepID=A0A3G4VH22_9VIBR|nr:hypothetical protein [Vibrio mediterranei]AYV24073.1 hypothetical protein ECB94_22660 [Vibrio mediterranei]
MRKIIKNLFVIGALLAGASSAYAYDYGVELKWNTDDIAQVLKTMPEQRASFKKLVDNGKIKDMFVENSQVGGQKTQLLKFVMEAESEQSVRNQLASLPLYQQDLVRINHIQLLGSKWLDNTPKANNFGLTFIWKSGVEPLEIDRVLGIDLQRVIALNQVGTVTSSYINTQNLENAVVRPTYLVAVLAKDAAHALEMSKQFEAVTMGYAEVQVEPLGHKLDMSKL